MLMTRHPGRTGKIVLLCLTAGAVAGGAVLDAQVNSPSGGVSRQFRYMMGTSVEVRAYNGDEATRTVAIDEAFAAIAEVDRVMSNYRADSELARVNTGAATAPVTVSDALFSVIAAAQQVSDRSGGAFDITVGPLMKLWGFHDKKPHVPSASELDTIKPLIGYRNILLDDSAHTIRFARPGVEIDLGAIGKGFAVELAANTLKRHGLDGFIDAGGNQYMLGLPPGKRTWTVGVRDPDHPDGLIGEIESAGGAVSTSANYATFLIGPDGKRYGHHMDPRTLHPTDACLSVTTISADGTLADAVSTAAFVLGPQRGLALIDSFSGMAGLIVYRGPDGKPPIVMTKTLEGRFHRVTASSAP